MKKELYKQPRVEVTHIDAKSSMMVLFDVSVSGDEGIEMDGPADPSGAI